MPTELGWVHFGSHLFLFGHYFDSNLWIWYVEKNVSVDMWTLQGHCGTCREYLQAVGMWGVFFCFLVHKLTLRISVRIFQDLQRRWRQKQARFGVANMYLCILYPNRPGGCSICFLKENICMSCNRIPRVNHHRLFLSQFCIHLGLLSLFFSWYQGFLCGYFRRGDSRWC